MSDEEVVLSDDLQAQIQKLAGMKDLLRKYMRPAMQKAVSLLSGAVEPNIPTLTGTAAATFGTHVLDGGSLSLTGYVGWKDEPRAWYMHMVEIGAKPHSLSAAPYQHMKSRRTGEWMTMHQHPGFPGRFLLSNALDSNQEAVESIFSQAADDMLGEVSIQSGE
jgi:hypothetical protein